MPKNHGHLNLTLNYGEAAEDESLTWSCGIFSASLLVQGNSIADRQRHAASIRRMQR